MCCVIEGSFLSLIIECREGNEQMKRAQHELQRSPNCDTSHAEFILMDMENRAKIEGNSHRCINGKWLSIFKDETSELTYIWQGGYPIRVVNRSAAISVLAHQ